MPKLLRLHDLQKGQKTEIRDLRARAGNEKLLIKVNYLRTYQLRIQMG